MLAVALRHRAHAVRAQQPLVRRARARGCAASLCESTSARRSRSSTPRCVRSARPAQQLRAGTCANQRKRSRSRGSRASAVAVADARWRTAGSGPAIVCALIGKQRPSGSLQHVVVEAVLVVPQAALAAADAVDRRADVDEVLEELGRDVLVDRVLACASSSAMPSRLRQYIAIQLVPSACSRCPPDGRPDGAVEHADVVEARGSRLRRCCCPRRPCGSPTT